MARPPYQYSPTVARFRNPDTGRWITRVQVREWLDKFIAASQANILAASTSYRAGNTSLAEWQSIVRDEVKDSHLMAEALARGGWGQLTQADFGRTGQRIREQYRYLGAFTAAVRDGTQRLDGQFMNRAKMYSASARSAFYASQGAVLADAGYTRERSLLHPAEHCQECVDEAARGWVSIGQLTPIGERTCLSSDKCTVEYA
jgi:hypothetical protein